tara:strand:- start:82 stop:525 length:444 start_codon:yes stop_codon:yes gene_type:complete
MVDIEDLKERFLNLEFDTQELRIDPEKSVTVARVTGEVLPEFTDPGHEDFQTPPAMLASLATGRHLPIDFPRLGGIPMDGGKAVTIVRPVKPGTHLTGRTHLHDIYAKQGRSGRMVFIVSRMEIFDADGDQVAINDSRMVVRERPDA